MAVLSNRAVEENAYTEIKSSSGLIGLLPLPRNVQVPSSYNWETENLDLVANEVLHGAPSGMTDRVLADIAQNIGGQTATAGFSRSGKVVNPKEEVFFRGINHRMFELTFDLAPSSQKESDAIAQFVKELSKAASPEKSGNGAYFEYPDTFSIRIIGSGGSIMIDRGEVALKEFDPNLTPDGFWVQHTDGRPVHITLSMSFVELALLTKDREEMHNILGA